MDVIKKPAETATNLVVNTYTGITKDRVERLLKLIELNPDMLKKEDSALTLLLKLMAVVDIPFLAEIESFVQGSFKSDTKGSGGLDFRIGTPVSIGIGIEAETRKITGADVWVKTKIKIDGGVAKSASELSGMKPVELKKLLEDAKKVYNDGTEETPVS